jgi:hypothetical protein
MGPGIPGPIRAVTISPLLRQYLELTPEQVTRMDRQNNALRQFEASKTSRYLQVQSELNVETARESLDPMALGLRYVELEGIRRELNAEQKRTIDAVQSVLTPAQRTRAAALQEVLRNYGTACEAVNNNIISVPVPTAAVRWFNTVELPNFLPGRSGGILGSTAPCALAPAVRTGDFITVSPAQPAPVQP